MNNNNVPVQSLKTLILSLISAVLLAFFILIAFVGPAEYGIDPIGLGKALGLTALAPVETPAHEKSVISCPVGEQLADWEHIVMITIPAQSGLEYKFYLEKGKEMTYQWVSEASLYFDFHGEPQGDTTGYFKSYQETIENQTGGTLTAPFTGTHGWYWKNETDKAVKITLKTKGQYKIKGLI